MDYPNTTKQKYPLVYPLSTAVPVVDEKDRLFSGGARVSPLRGSGASESHQNLGGAIPCVYKCVLGCRCTRLHSGVCPASPAPPSLYRVSGLAARNSHFGRTGRNLVKSWGRYWFWVLLWTTLTQPRKKIHLSTPFRRRYRW